MDVWCNVSFSLFTRYSSTIPRQPASPCGGHRFQTTAALGVNHGPRRSADTSLDDRRPGVLCRRTPRLERPAASRHLIAQPRHLSTLAEDTSVSTELSELTLAISICTVVLQSQTYATLLIFLNNNNNKIYTLLISKPLGMKYQWA